MKKKFFAVALATTMVASSLTIVSAEETNRTVEPIYMYDFEDGTAGTATIKGSGKVEDSNDPHFGKVFNNNVGGEAQLRTDYLALPEDTIGKVVDAGNKEFSLSMWIKGTDLNYWGALFCAKNAETPATEWWPHLNLACNTKGSINCAGWIEVGTNSDENQAIVSDGKWHHMAYVVTADDANIYLDGKVIQSATAIKVEGDEARLTEGIFTDYAKNNLTTVSIGGNSIANWNDNDVLAYFDDIAIYATALTNDDVNAIIKNKMTDETKPSEDETTTDKVDSPDTNNPDVEPTTPANPSEDSSKPSVEPTTPANPSEDPSNPSVEQPTTSDSVTSDFDVTDADAEKVNKEAVVTGLPENVTLRVASIEKSSTDYNAIAEFVNKELKGKKVAAADLSLVKNGVAYAEQPNGKVKVTLPLFENIKDAKWIQVYRYDNAAKKFVEVDKVVEVKDGKFTFETDHFTPYLFASVNGPEEEPTTTAQPTTTGKTVTDTSNKPKTGDSAPIAVFAGMAAAGLAVFAVSKKRKNA